MFKLVKKTLATKENCLMTAAIFGGVCVACLIKARSFDKNNAVIMAKYSVVD